MRQEIPFDEDHKDKRVRVTQDELNMLSQTDEKDRWSRLHQQRRAKEKKARAKKKAQRQARKRNR